MERYHLTKPDHVDDLVLYDFNKKIEITSITPTNDVFDVANQNHPEYNLGYWGLTLLSEG